MICRCACNCRTELARAMPRAVPVGGGPRCGTCEYANHVDHAKRASDVVQLHLLADREAAINSWVALRMSDGGSDNILYPSRHIAVRHQLHEFQCCYLKIPPDGLSIGAAEAFLRFNRQLYDNGFRMADPDKDTEVIMPLRTEMLR